MFFTVGPFDMAAPRRGACDQTIRLAFPTAFRAWKWLVKYLDMHRLAMRREVLPT